MSQTENVELTVCCLIHKENQFLLQDRIKEDWKGFTLPGGHVEKGESIVDATLYFCFTRMNLPETWFRLRKVQCTG